MRSLTKYDRPQCHLKGTLRISLSLLVLLILSNRPASAQITSTAQLLDAMQTKHRDKWFKAFTFTQETIRYNADRSVRDTATWYEAIQYPDQFRIDFDDNGRFVIFDNDSSFRYENYNFQTARLEPQEFLLFKGGMYYTPPSQVLKKLKEYGYDTSLFRNDQFKGRRVYVIGAEEGDLKTKQFWIDADYFYTVRRISQVGGDRTLDVHYEDHKRVKQGWVEQTVTFYLDEQLRQIEYYLEIEAFDQLPSAMFNRTLPAKEWFRSPK